MRGAAAVTVAAAYYAHDTNGTMYRDNETRYSKEILGLQWRHYISIIIRILL